MRPIYLTKTLTAADDDNISLSQTPLAAGNLTITGAAASGGVATLDTPRRVLLTFAASEVGHTFVVYGTNAVNGTAISETVAGTGIGTTYTNLDFYTVTRVSISAAATGAIKVGTNAVGSTPWQLENYHASDIEQSIAVVVTGTVTYSVEYTYDNFMGAYAADTGVWSNGSTPTVFTDPILASVTATGETNFDSPITGWRVTVSSGTGSVAIKGIQAGIMGS